LRLENRPEVVLKKNGLAPIPALFIRDIGYIFIFL
jgi:hypothetical protein